MRASDAQHVLPRMNKLLSVALMSLALCAHAQTNAPANKEQEQLRRMRMQMQQLQQQQAELQEAQARADQGRVQAESALKATTTELQDHKQAASKAGRRVDALSREVASLKDERDKLLLQVQQLTELSQTTSQQLTQEKAQLSQTQGSLQQSQAQARQLTTSLDQCRSDNAQLYQLGTDLLARYENKGWREVMGAQEPFFQYARARLENTKAQYQDKLEAARSKAP